MFFCHLGWPTQANAAKKRAKPSSADADAANSKRPRGIDSVQEGGTNGVSVVGTGLAGDGSIGNGPAGSSGPVGSSGSIDSGAVRSGVLSIGGPSASSAVSPDTMGDSEKALVATAARIGGRNFARGLADDETEMHVSVFFVCDDTVSIFVFVVFRGALFCCRFTSTSSPGVHAHVGVFFCMFRVCLMSSLFRHLICGGDRCWVLWVYCETYKKKTPRMTLGRFHSVGTPKTRWAVHEVAFSYGSKYKAQTRTKVMMHERSATSGARPA